MTHAIVTRDSDGRTQTRACSPDTEGAIRVEVLAGFKEPADGPRFVYTEYQDYCDRPARRRRGISYLRKAGNSYYGDNNSDRFG